MHVARKHGKLDWSRISVLTFLRGSWKKGGQEKEKFGCGFVCGEQKVFCEQSIFSLVPDKIIGYLTSFLSRLSNVVACFVTMVNWMLAMNSVISGFCHVPSVRKRILISISMLCACVQTCDRLLSRNSPVSRSTE